MCIYDIYIHICYIEFDLVHFVKQTGLHALCKLKGLWNIQYKLKSLNVVKLGMFPYLFIQSLVLFIHKTCIKHI